MLLNYGATLVKYFSIIWGCCLDPVCRSQLWGIPSRVLYSRQLVQVIASLSNTFERVFSRNLFTNLFRAELGGPLQTTVKFRFDQVRPAELQSLFFFAFGSPQGSRFNLCVFFFSLLVLLTECCLEGTRTRKIDAPKNEDAESPIENKTMQRCNAMNDIDLHCLKWMVMKTLRSQTM